MNMKKITLSKYPFIKGIQCSKAMYLHYRNPEYKSLITEEQKMIFEKGKEVGEVARNLYRGGYDLSEGNTIKGKKLIEVTKKALSTDKQIFYEPAFESPDGVGMFIGDILVKSSNKIKLIEVKSSTSIKLPEHILDIGFQWKILQDNGLD